MKKILSTIVNTVMFAAPAAVLAQAGTPGNNYGLDNLNEVQLGNKPLLNTVADIINVLLGVLGVIAVVLILAGGFKWMTSGGNEEKVGEAKKLLSAGLIGLVIILAAYAIASYVVGTLSNATV